MIPVIKKILPILMTCACLITYGREIPGILARNIGLSYFAKGVSDATLATNDSLLLAEKYLCVASTRLGHGDHIVNKALGRIAITRNDEKSALEYWRRGSVEAAEIIDWGELARNSGQWAEAQHWYEWATVVDKKGSDSWVFLGTSYEAQGQYDLAIDAYERAISLGSYSGRFPIGASTPYFHIGLLHLLDRIRPSDPILVQSYFDKAFLLNDFGPSGEATEFYLWRGWALLKQSRYVEAIQMAEEVLKRVPNDPDARAVLAKAHYRAYGDFAFAEKQFQLAISHAPSYFWSYLYLGGLYEQIGDSNLARQTYEAGLRVAPGNATLESASTRLDNP